MNVQVPTYRILQFVSGGGKIIEWGEMTLVQAEAEIRDAEAAFLVWEGTDFEDEATDRVRHLEGSDMAAFIGDKLFAEYADRWEIV